MTTETTILESRARKTRRRVEEGQARAVAGLYVVVSLAERLIGLPADGLREVVRTPSIAELPGLPAWLPGIVHLRGELLGLVDLTRLYRLPELENGELIAVLRGPRGELGVPVDRVVGVREVYWDEVSRTADTGLPAVGTTRDLVILIEPRGLFDDERVVVKGLT